MTDTPKTEALEGVRELPSWICLEGMNKDELAAYELGCTEMNEALQRILDGRDSGEGIANNPWETLRRRVLALVSPQPVTSLPTPAAHRYWTFGHRPRWQIAGAHVPPGAEPLYTADQVRECMRAALAATPAAPRSAAPGWMPIETAPKEVELLGWREDCGPLLIMHTSFDRFATEKECDETDEAMLFQKDWFGAGIPGGMERLDGSLAPTHWQPIDAPPVTPSEGGKQ